MINQKRKEDSNLLEFESSETGLRYIVKNFISCREAIKINLLVIFKNNAILLDTPNISSDKRRTEVAKKCADICNLDFTQIKKDLLRLTQVCQRELEKTEQTKTEVEQIKISEEEKDSAMRFLRQPNLMERIKNDIVGMGVVGEDINSLMVYLLATSRLLDSPLSIVLKGSSSSGKSFLVSKILEMFPPGEIQSRTYLSAKALFYGGEYDLSHKVLAIMERPGAEASDYPLRIMQSEKILKIEVTIKDPKTGRFTTEIRVVNGPSAIIETTTKNLIHPENETRVFSLCLDESIEQTARILEAQRMGEQLNSGSLNIDREIIRRRHIAIQTLLKPYKVVIPFSHLMTFPSDKLRSRRDQSKFISLIKSIALLHQFQRKFDEVKGFKILLADVDDYEAAFNLSQKVIFENISGIPPKSRDLLKKVATLNSEFTVNDIIQLTGLNRYEIKQLMQPLVDWGYADKLFGRKGQRYVYKVVKSSLDDAMKGLLKPEDLRQKHQADKSKIDEILTDAVPIVNLKT